MIKLRKQSLSLVAGAILLVQGLPVLAAGPSIVFTLDGKAVTAVPVDRLGELTVTVSTGGQSFKQVFSGQWSGLDQAQTLKATPFTKGTAMPKLDKAHSWANLDLAVTSGDSNWGGLKTLSASMSKGAPELALYKATTEDDLAFTSLFYRKDYTGKELWQNGGWVKETRWSALGAPLGQAVLKLEPPTFASSLDPKVLFAPAVEKFNTDKTYYATRAQFISQTLLYPTTYGGRTVDFEGSRVIEFAPVAGQEPVFNWNYNEDDDSEYVSANFTVNMKIHSVMHTTMESIPIPMTTEADFNCPIRLSAKRQLSQNQWVVSDLEFNDSIRKTCKTADGKTADEVLKAANPMSNFGF